MGNTDARPPGRPPKETAEFRAEAVRLVEEGGQSLRQVARDLGLSAESLHRWVKQAKTDAGEGPAGALTTDERAELRRLRQEVKTLQLEREILKKAAAFFAKEML
jgi:transposase-like protein